MKRILLISLMLLTVPLFAQLASQDFGADTENITPTQVPVTIRAWGK